MNFTAKNVIRVTRKGLDPAKVTDVILASVPGMSDDDLLLRLASVPDVDNDFALLKIKVEQALRTNGKSSPNYKRSGVAAIIRAWMSWYLTAVYGKVRQIPMVYPALAVETQLIKRYAVSSCNIDDQ